LVTHVNIMNIDFHGTYFVQDDATVTDDTRLRSIVPTASYLLEKGANIILCSLLGRTKGEIIENGKNGRLNPVVP